MIRTVDLGPFKHQIDDGLELRKSAFECLDVLLDVCPDAIDIDQHVAALQSGLGVRCPLLYAWLVVCAVMSAPSRVGAMCAATSACWSKRDVHRTTTISRCHATCW